MTPSFSKGSRIRFHYDDLDRVTWKEYLDTDDPDVFYDYDNLSIPNGKGRLYQVSKKDSLPAIAVSETTYADGYDALGQVISVTKSIQTSTGILTDYTTGYQYDMAGRPTQMVYPDGTQVDYEYFAGTSLLEKVTSPGTGGDTIEHAEFSAYTPTGKMGNIYYYNQTQTDYTYDPASGRLKDIKTYDTDYLAGPRIQHKVYTYTNAGDVKTITDVRAGITRTYTYDKLHRLTGESSDSGAEDDFDTQDIVPVYPYSGETQTSGVKYPVHAAKGLSVNGRQYGYEYDANGNMTLGWDTRNGIASREFSYNADNMPTEIVHATLGATTYTYDEGGQRVKKSAPGNTIYYVGEHYEVKNGAPVKYIFAGNIRLAMVNTSGTFYYHKDHLGSTAALSDMSGGIYGGTSAYLPFGGQRNDNGVTTTAYMFTDQEQDAESGLYNYGARLYDPVAGVFVTPDSIVQSPFDPQMLNRYSYCRNNPLIYVDPSGHFLGLSAGVTAFIAAMAKGAAVGAVVGGAMAAVTGGDIAQGMITGAISGAMFGGAGSIIHGSGMHAITQAGIHAIAGAASGAINASITGGDIGKGALVGAMSGSFSKFVGASYLEGLDNVVLQFAGYTLVGGVTGGIASVMYGGDFGNGFMSGMQTSAYGFLFNKTNFGERVFNAVSNFFKGVADTMIFPPPSLADPEAMKGLDQAIKGVQVKYNEYGEGLGEWGPENPWYYSWGVKTQDGVSYRDRIKQKESTE